MKHQPTLDQIIDRHTTTPASRFRPFTWNDWQAFSGCESAAPLIFEGNEILVVVDGVRISVLNGSADELEEGREFASHEQALQFGEAIAAADGMDSARVILHAATLTARGFEVSGKVYLKRIGHSHQIAIRSKTTGELPSSWRDSVLVVSPFGEDPNEDPILEWSAGNLDGFERGMRSIASAVADVEGEA